jgi:hypothetical protein
MMERCCVSNAEIEQIDEILVMPFCGEELCARAKIAQKRNLHTRSTMTNICLTEFEFRFSVVN